MDAILNIINDSDDTDQYIKIQACVGDDGQKICRELTFQLSQWEMVPDNIDSANEKIARIKRALQILQSAPVEYSPDTKQQKILQILENLRSRK